MEETELYYKMKAALPDRDVVHHARPEWLGRQHLDIFIPSFAVAVEFQGEQHDQSVEYFGGEEAFKATQRRDKTKVRKCKQHGIRLVYVRPGYSFDSVLREVKSPSSALEK